MFSRKRTWATTYLTACYLIAASVPLAAQTPDTATIQGHITDPSGAAVAAAHVMVTNPLTGLQRTAQSDDSGVFSLAGLPISGSYDVTVQKQGFADAHLSDVTLAGGSTAQISLQLNVAAGQTKVTVTGNVGGVRT